MKTWMVGTSPTMTGMSCLWVLGSTLWPPRNDRGIRRQPLCRTRNRSIRASPSRSTSVGSLAIERFQRPVAYQDVPAEVLPEAVRDDNPWGLTRRIDGELELP